MTKITIDVLKEYRACNEAVEMFGERTKGEVESIRLLRLLIKDKKYDWANWLIIRVMNHQQFLAYAIYAAEQVLDNFEKKFPNDNRPRLAIEAAKKVLKRDTKKNRSAAESAARSAWSAWSAARSAESAAWSAWSAWSAAEFAAEPDAGFATWFVARFADKIKIKILKYGIKLLKETGLTRPG